MSNDDGLVDEYDRLQHLKKELDEKIEKMRWEIIRLAQTRNTEVLFGTNKKCAIKTYQKVVYPEDKTRVEQVLRNKGLYERFSSVNYFKLGPKILKGEIDKEIIDLVKIEQAFRVSLIDRGV